MTHPCGSMGHFRFRTLQPAPPGIHSRVENAAESNLMSRHDQPDPPSTPPTLRGKAPSPYAAAVLGTARRRRLFGPGDHLLVALSAGPDSTALLAAVSELRDAGYLDRVSALHVDHGLRAGGEQDAACARRACDALAVPFASVRVQVAPGNVQAEARRARYAALLAEAARVGATHIATGHTLTDQAETVLLRLLRGAGARGLSGIPARRGALVRPLLERAREEGIAYLRARGIAFRDDPTNATPRFARNRLRLALSPVLRELAPSFERALARTADLARADERALHARAKALAGPPRRGPPAPVALEALRAEPLAVRRRVVRLLWARAGGEGTLEARHVEAVLRLARARRPGRAALPGGVEARCRYGRLELGVPPRRDRPTPAPLEVAGPGRHPLPGGGQLWLEVRLPAGVPWPLVLRTRRAGDRIRPEGGAGSKSLKRWLIDRKVPREARAGLWLLAAGAEVLAIPALGVVAEGLGPAGAGLTARIAKPT